jgi:hypothetical protein
MILEGAEIRDTIFYELRPDKHSRVVPSVTISGEYTCWHSLAVTLDNNSVESRLRTEPQKVLPSDGHRWVSLTVKRLNCHPFCSLFPKLLAFPKVLELGC